MASIKFLGKDFEVPDEVASSLVPLMAGFESVYREANAEADMWARAASRLGAELRRRGVSLEEIARISNVKGFAERLH